MKTYKGIVSLITCILLTHFSFGQIRHVKFEQLDSLQKAEKRPVIVFLHTSWCKYCGSMENVTLKNKEIVQLLNEKFYYVPLDIEEKKDIVFRGHTFRYKPTGTGTGIHELAEQIGTINGAIAYPGICFLNPNLEITYQQEGFIKAPDFIKMLENLKLKSTN